MTSSASGGGVLADIAASFSYDGTTSDLAAQFYVLERAGTQATPLTFTATTLPKDVADRLAVNALRFQDLSPWLQRAVLWDSGYVLVNDQGEVATIYTPCGSKSGMANVAVSVADYKSAGCTTQTCKLATGAAFARSKFCTGTQMGTVARCASSDFSAKTNSSMWATGGSKATVPEPNMKHHEWTDDGHDYLMYAIHTATPETDYGLCPDTTGSLIIPCVPLKGDKRKWCRPSPGRLVDEWLQSSNNLTAKTNTTGRATASVPAALSDMTKQFERLHKAGQEMPRLSTSLQIPADVTARLAKHSLSFITLPGLLQRALLWEMGYVLQQGTMALSTIYTRCNQTMADISLSESMMKQTTCRISSCNTSTTRFTDDKTCVADVTKIASCATGGVPSAGTGALWASGSAAPDITIVAYTFAGGGKTQQLMSIHATPQSFSTLCPASGSIAIPCAVYPASPSAQQNWCRPALGNNVEAWLKTTAAASNSSSSFNLLYLIPIVGSTLVLVAIVFWCYCCRERRKPKPTELDDVVLSPLANEPVRPTRPVRRPAEVPRITQLRRQSSNATSPGRFRPSSTDDERARRSSNNERAPGLADNDGARRSSNTKAARRSRPSEDRPRVPVGAGHDRDHRSAERQRAVRGTSEPRSSPPMKNSAASIAANILDFEPELVSRRIKLSSIEFLTRLARGSRVAVRVRDKECRR
ncbi:TPA: LOW QUALITY PROTEIN: hypothetical protein N0F65_000456 [Lagenidium giganteum]|uniref:Transmembrane protein n=1 Tax=Lagenidium giganteum TaxID=4803 RepID=A0AAV2YYK6_9STRA|nr:TPA: LOW QUALITY PROTEIN: hypothetical protein N0F65_000456 [Lagenidium giganteum]